MEQPGVSDALDTVEVSGAVRRWVMGQSVEAVGVRKQVASIVRFFGDLDAAMESLGPDEGACQLSRLVRAELLQSLMVDAAEQFSHGDDAVDGSPPVDPILKLVLALVSARPGMSQ